MKKEFGKWLMDIAKYMATVILLSSVFSEMAGVWIAYILCGLSVIITLILGLFLVRDSNK